MRAVTPKTMYDREGFEMLRAEGEEGFCEGESRVDNEMEGYNGNSRLLVKPLKVVLRSYLNRSGFCKREVCGRVIEGAMVKLVVRKVGLKGSKLSIGPPILLGGKGVDKVWGTRREGALRKLRGDY